MEKDVQPEESKTLHKKERIKNSLTLVGIGALCTSLIGPPLFLDHGRTAHEQRIRKVEKALGIRGKDTIDIEIEEAFEQSYGNLGPLHYLVITYHRMQRTVDGGDKVLLGLGIRSLEQNGIHVDQHLNEVPLDSIAEKIYLALEDQHHKPDQEAITFGRRTIQQWKENKQDMQPLEEAYQQMLDLYKVGEKEQVKHFFDNSIHPQSPHLLPQPKHFSRRIQKDTSLRVQNIVPFAVQKNRLPQKRV